MKFTKSARRKGGLPAAALLAPALIALTAPAASAAATAPGRPAVHKPVTISESALMKSGNDLLKSGRTTVSPAGAFNIFNNDSGRCLGIANGNAGIWDCTGNPDQTWQAVSETSNGWTLLVNGNGQCLTAPNGAAANGTHVVAWASCDNGVEQWWRGYAGEIYNLAGCTNSGPCTQVLTVQSGSTANGAPVVMWNTNDNNPAHNWTW